MKHAALFGLLALVPAALNAAAPASLRITAASCLGTTRTTTLPLRPGAPARDDGQPCCAKGCHSGSSRKRCQRAC